MKHPTTCKFCKKEIVLEIDDAYAELGDRHKIIPMAACNRCADLRVRKRNLENAIKDIAMALVQLKSKASPDTLAISRDGFTRLTKKYTSMIADWVHSTSPWWDSTIVESLMEHPDKWPDILQQCWKMYKST